MKKVFLISIVIIILLINTACPSDGPEQSSIKELTSYSFIAAVNPGFSGDIIGEFTGADIAVTVPYGADVTSLIATFITVGASVTVGGTEQISGSTVNDFSGPVNYKVTAEDGSFQDYTVSVSIAAPASEKEITYSGFYADTNPELDIDIAGEISGTDISIAVPLGTNVTSLVMTFHTTGESVSMGGEQQNSGSTPHDFSAPVTYRATAEDGTYQDYTVTVIIGIPGETELHTANSISFNLNYAPGGRTFTMGELVEINTKSVTLTKDFWIGETEVTQGLWEDVWGTSWPGPDPEGSGCGTGLYYPAYYVTWYDAVAFCNELTLADEDINDTEVVYYSNSGLTTVYTTSNASSENDVYVDWSKKGYRLPTDAEWEYAARWIDRSSWNHGNHISGDIEYACFDAVSCAHELATDEQIGEYAWWSGNNSGDPGDSTYGTKEVGTKPVGGNGLGLFNMSGNVNEWCYDWFTALSAGSETDPIGPVSGISRVRRGGDWFYSASSLRSARRGNAAPTTRAGNLGLRLCRTAD